MSVKVALPRTRLELTRTTCIRAVDRGWADTRYHAWSFGKPGHVLTPSAAVTAKHSKPPTPRPGLPVYLVHETTGASVNTVACSLSRAAALVALLEELAYPWAGAGPALAEWFGGLTPVSQARLTG